MCVVPRKKRYYLCRKKSFAFLPAFFFLDFYQDDICANLANTLPGDDKFSIASEKRADTARPRYDNGCHKAGADIDLHVADTAQRAAGTDIDDLFLAQFAYAHEITACCFFYFMQKSEDYALTVKNGFAILQTNKKIAMVQPGS